MNCLSRRKNARVKIPVHSISVLCCSILSRRSFGLIMPENSFEIHGASVADGPTDRNGDFVIGSTVIHCTTMPGALLIENARLISALVAVPSLSRFLSAYIPLLILPKTLDWPDA